MSGGDATQNGAPPPPPPPSGSPFGRFVQHPVLLVGLVALMISLPLAVLSVQGGGGGENGGAPSSGDVPAVVGQWEGSAARRSSEGAIDVELTIRSVGGDNDGTLTRGGCSGALSHRSTTGRSVEFSYIEQLDPDGCPSRATVIATPLAGDRLRFEERRGRRVVAEGRLTAH